MNQLQAKVAEHLRLQFYHCFMGTWQLLPSSPFAELPGRSSPWVQVSEGRKAQQPLPGSGQL